MFVTQALATALTKLASAGLVAKTAVGLTVAVAAVTGAAAGDVLPAPVQNTVADVVGTVSPLDLPHSGDSTATDTSTTTTVAGTTSGTSTSGAANAPESTPPVAPTTPENFGKQVSGMATSTGVDGETVSGMAPGAEHRNANARPQSSTVDNSPASTPSATPAPPNPAAGGSLPTPGQHGATDPSLPSHR